MESVVDKLLSDMSDSVSQIKSISDCIYYVYVYGLFILLFVCSIVGTVLGGTVPL